MALLWFVIQMDCQGCVVGFVCFWCAQGQEEEEAGSRHAAAGVRHPAGGAEGAESDIQPVVHVRLCRIPGVCVIAGSGLYGNPSQVV